MNRNRESIPIMGINTSSPGHTVKDGACEDVLNLRYFNDALQNVCKPDLLQPITNSNGYNIVHRVDAMPQGHYIAVVQKLNDAVNLVVVHIVGGVVDAVDDKSWFGVGPIGGFRFSSFGNVLYVTCDSGEYLQEDCYIYKDDKFTKFNMDEIKPPEFTIEYNRKSSANAALGGGTTILKSSNFGKDNEFIYGEYVKDLTDEGFFVGACMIIVAYIMYDGNIIKPSTPELVSSYGSEIVNDRIGKVLLKKRIGGTLPNYTYGYIDNIVGAKISLTIKTALPASHLIKGIRVFSTRINNIFNYEDIVSKIINGNVFEPEDSNGVTRFSRSLIVNEDAYDVNQPFYELTDILKTDELTVVIDTKKLMDVVHNNIYKPAYSNHKTISASKFEYNNRLHIYNIKTEMFLGYYDSVIYPDYTPSQYVIGLAMLIIDFELNIDGKKITFSKQCSIQIVKYFAGRFVGNYFVIPNLITYPDTRVEKISVQIIANNFVEYTFSLNTKKAYANNLAYIYLYNCKQCENVSNVVLFKYKETGENYISKKSSVANIYQSNKLQVSAVNNPFYYAADNIYTIGENSSTIDAINTAAEQVSETKFGVYPLYVFTDRSIHAMEVGDGEVLYRNVIGISNERKLPTTTTVGAANVVFFISDQGVMALEGRRAFCISGPLDDNPELPTRDFMKYISSARLSYNPKYGELIVYNPAYEYAYVYSIASKVWSRRDWTGEPLSTFELIMDDGIYSTIEEDKSKPYSKISIVTRAIKLGSLEYKRVETVLARMLNGAQTSFTIVLEGSNDLQTWRSLITVTDIKLLRRTMASYIYHRVRIEAFVSDHFSITHFDVEYYNRFVRRLR